MGAAWPPVIKRPSTDLWCRLRHSDGTSAAGRRDEFRSRADTLTPGLKSAKDLLAGLNDRLPVHLQSGSLPFEQELEKRRAALAVDRELRAISIVPDDDWALRTEKRKFRTVDIPVPPEFGLASGTPGLGPAIRPEIIWCVQTYTSDSYTVERKYAKHTLEPPSADAVLKGLKRGSHANFYRDESGIGAAPSRQGDPRTSRLGIKSISENPDRTGRPPAPPSRQIHLNSKSISDPGGAVPSRRPAVDDNAQRTSMLLRASSSVNELSEISERMADHMLLWTESRDSENKAPPINRPGHYQPEIRPFRACRA